MEIERGRVRTAERERERKCVFVRMKWGGRLSENDNLREVEQLLDQASALEALMERVL